MTERTDAPQAPTGNHPAHGLWALALALLIALVLPQLRPLLPVDETRYLTVAWEMHGAGAPLVPHLNGEIYAHKPPLLFWLINLLWAVTGPVETAARLVGPAFGVLAVGLTWQLGRMLRPARPATGATAALILATTGAFALYGSLTMFDTMLACAVLLGLMALLGLDRGRRIWPTALLGLALAFGVLAKGPVILVHLAPVALLRPLWSFAPERQGYGRWLRALGLGFLLGLVLVAVWLLPALYFGGADYRAEVLWRQSAGRMMNAFDHVRPVWFFLAALPLLLWPWGWRAGALKGLMTARAGLADRVTRFLLIWFTATVLIFSVISSKQMHYLLPALPAVALLLASGAAPRKGLAPALLSLLGIIPVLIWVVLLYLGKASLDRLPVTSLSLGDIVLVVALALALPVALVWIGRRTAWLGWSLVTPVVLVFVHLALRAPLHEHFDTSRFAAEIGRAPEAGVAISGYRYQGEFGFTARLPQGIETLPPEQVQTWVAEHPGGLLISTDALPAGTTPVLQAPLAGNLLRLGRVE